MLSEKPWLRRQRSPIRHLWTFSSAAPRRHLITRSASSTRRRILAKAGATARALCLHQISLEECSKIENMGAWATSLLSGLEVEQNKVLAAFRRHSSKNKSNAYMVEGSKAEKDAKGRGDWETARDEFKKLQTEFHETSNDAKNASLYVDWKDGEFVSPSEQITPEMLAQIFKRNQTFLGYAFNSLKMLKRLDKSPDGLQ